MVPTPSLYELSLQYEQEAQGKTAQIGDLRRRYNALSRRFGSREADRLYALLQLCYTQRRELLQTAAQLRHYYRLSSNPPQCIQTEKGGVAA